jgi:Carboxypeptidase regulatory-like domain
MRLITTLALLLICVVAALGQSNKGGITGTVLDANGAAVPGATVTITNIGTNQSVKVTTSDAGAFSVSDLDPVAYRIVAELAGFKKSVIESVKVDTASVATANIKLETGTVAETVTITGDGALLNTESGTTSQTITERALRDLPLNNRSVLDLAVTVPNVSGDAGSEDPGVTGDQPVPGFNLNLNGGRAGSTAILADGVNNTGIGIARAVVSFTPETVQEFTVQTSAFSAEFGTTGGGVINVTTKSGTNSINGVALWYTRNPKFNATPFSISNAPRPSNNLRYNQASFTVGGPIVLPKFGEGGKSLYNGKNKSFFFFAYEPRWRQDFLTGSALVPSAPELTGDFRNLVRTASGIVPQAVATQFGLTSNGSANIYQQFVLANGRLVPIVLTGTNQFCQFNDPRRVLVPQVFNGVTIQTQQCTAATNLSPNPALNVIPAEFIDPIAPKILQFMPPAGSYFLDGSVVRNYFQQRSVQQNETRYTLRLDHNINDNTKLNFRYTKTPAIGIRSAGNDINGNTGVFSDAKQLILGLNKIFSPTVVNDLKLNYTRGNFSEDYSPEFAIKTGRSAAGELGLPHLTPGGIPLFLLTQDGSTYTSADIGSAASTNNFNVEQRFNINDVLYWTHENMTWKFGVDLNDERLTSTPFFAASGGRWQFRVVNTSNNRSTTITNGGNEIASLLIGVPNSVDLRPLLLDYDYRWKSGAAFVQNDWKFRPNLTLNLGLRYSLQYPRSEKHNLQGSFLPDLAQSFPLTDTQRRTLATNMGVAATDPIPSFIPSAISIPPFAFSGRGGRSKYISPIDYLGFEPRFGFAWQPKMKIFGLDLEKKSVVFRGGFGISHAPLTGNNRSPNPDFGGFVNVATLANGSTGTVDPNTPIRLSGNAPLQGSSNTLDQSLGTDANGLVFLNSLGIPGVAVDLNGSGKVPYAQNWNLTMQFEPIRGLPFEVAYVGNRGVHLYLPQININQRDINQITSLESGGVDLTGTIADPLGRRNLQGAVITISRASVLTPFVGFDPLSKYFDPSASSIRHAWYVDVRKRVGRGLSFSANYTHGKSIDNASDASPDTRVLSTGQARGQVSLGAPLDSDRAISTYDVANSFASTFIWDLPFGRNQRFLGNAPKIVNSALGGWTVSGVFRMPGGNPFLPFITDPNRLGGVLFNRVVRPDIVPGVPLKNPLWKRNCPTGNGCEPFINPAAFMRPVEGQLGNAPRSLNIRPPRQEYFDFSLSKDFPWPFASNEGKRKINFRVDLINAFNHPNFRFNNTGNTPFGLGTFPTELTTETFNGVTQAITIAEYNTWATFWNTAHPADTVPIQSTTAGAPIVAPLQTIRNNVNAVRLPPRSGSTSGALPLNFFHVQLPQGFATTNPLAFDLRSLDQFKLYRIRQNYDTNFGTLTGVFPAQNPRYVQFGIRIIF